ncbi:holdfast anchoring protein HfaB [Brevundimonas subvibrioides]|uniref:holdfast anchoring protein HfaB n=1 Tax=Brevundimonas subvibrioides TaxID=74313 RepID=UPI0022B5A192|nr:holdfast anchoring protein HfaB [Brevundimonas subvibrioides]
MTRSILSISTLVLGLVCVTMPGVAAAAPEDGTVSGGRVQATSNYTPYTPALICLAERNRAMGRRAPRVSVGRIGDLTGRVDFDTGARVSQGASLFAITALARAGAPVVERLDNTVSQLELDYAQKHLLSDTPELAGQSAENFRPIFAGQVAGSDFFIVGGITELNYNIRSSGLNAQVGETAVTGLRGRAGLSDYVMNVAIDLRMVDSRSQIVVDTVSFQKQLVGREMNLGLSTGSDSVVGALSGGTQAVEPLQAAVRTLVERGVFELLAGLQAEGTYSGCLNENEAAS